MPDSPSLTVQRFPAPRREELEALLGRRTGWLPCPEAPISKGPAVYFVRQPDPVPRWQGIDLSGILYVGKTYEWAKRGRVLRLGTHLTARRMEFLRQFCPSLKADCLTMQCSMLAVASEWEAIFWESYFILSYYYAFGEIPPLNRQRPRSFFKHGHKGGDILAWDDVAAGLRDR
jgi:hypothetical protein